MLRSSGRWMRDRGKNYRKYWIVIILVILATGAMATMVLAQTVQEVRVKWNAYIAAPAPQVEIGKEQPSNIFTLLERRSAPGLLPRQRNPELSSDQIVVIALDTQGKEIDWQIIPDPRILRAEFPGPTGELRGEVLHHAETELLITLPNDPSVKELRLYHPHWTGTAFILDLLGTIPLP
ncbi:MAG: hypothetical protein FJ041_05830 [Candidatus Cloacimonetes bacterium]|nr:hypothetical protein [Deltaproteobacteria bacterium]MBM4399824.1 hypothetical protein [Candidatus Cloacimonadota bacterium]